MDIKQRIDEFLLSDSFTLRQLAVKNCIGALLLLFSLSAIAQEVDYEVLKEFSPTLYRVVSQYEKEISRPLASYEEIDELMKTDGRFLELWKEATKEMCALPSNDKNLDCIRLYGGIGSKG